MFRGDACPFEYCTKLRAEINTYRYVYPSALFRLRLRLYLLYIYIYLHFLFVFNFFYYVNVSVSFCKSAILTSVLPFFFFQQTGKSFSLSASLVFLRFMTRHRKMLTYRKEKNTNNKSTLFDILKFNFKYSSFYNKKNQHWNFQLTRYKKLK